MTLTLQLNNYRRMYLIKHELKERIKKKKKTHMNPLNLGYNL
jgi:hypothetical protein